MIELMILRVLHIRGWPRKAHNIIAVVWRPPPHSWIKVNIDGSAFGAPGLSRCSWVFRTHRGFVHDYFSIFLGVGYAFVSELAAAIHAIDFA
ncbi:Ribonuclease H-like domain containing protein [Trema orientale]|uniref:Ribonuclease H-like domain containing protein n=1 Tax=Trema orientale TaxID=63057 RepID=A0A2P5FRD7_TREOI|nr:Ribonuclease H-like domain containing protein [Trema orientale]